MKGEVQSQQQQGVKPAVSSISHPSSLSRGLWGAIRLA